MRSKSPRSVSVPALAALFLAAAPAWAVSPADPDPDGWPPGQSALRRPEEVSLPLDPATQDDLRRSVAGIRDFARSHPSWSITVDPYTRAVDRAFGEGLRARGAGSIDEVGRGFMIDHAGLLPPGLDLSEEGLVLNLRSSVVGPATATRIVRYDQRAHGLPVLGAGLTLGLRDETVFYVSTRALGPVAASARPRIGEEEALESVGRHLEGSGIDPSDLIRRREASLAFHPGYETNGASRALRHRLVWILSVKPREAAFYEWHTAWVDAHDGEVIAFFPEAAHLAACSADPGEAHATVTGGVRPNRANDPEVVRNLPYVRVDVGGTLVDTDLNGRYPYTGGAASSDLLGAYFRMHCDACIFQPGATGAGGDISFGTGGASGGVPVAGNGTSTPAERTTFFHANQTRRLLEKWGNAFFDEIDAFVNINDTCNAFSSGHILGFFIDAGNCRNTGEIRDVIYHELGHTWDRLDGSEITDGSMSEWKGDMLAILGGGDSCLGESFRKTGGPSTACNGVRDLDEKAPGRTDHPLTPAECATCATLTIATNNCGTGVHCNGEITGQATWHLLRNLLTGTDYITGAAIPGSNPALSAERARWLLERLLIAGGPPMQTDVPTMPGVSVYDAIMLMDDNDANLANGTPHAAYINAAFAHHQVAEAPLVADSANCAAPADPVPDVTLERDETTGLPFVRIDWTPVGGATSFDVFRNDTAGEAFLPIAMDLAGGSVRDTGVEIGATYRYFIAAVETSGCAAISPGGNIVEMTIEPAEVAVQSAVAAEALTGADGDGRIEPGELVSVQVTLEEIGGLDDATGVTATLSSMSPFSPAVDPGPVSFGTVPAGGASAGAAPFEVFVGPSEVCGGRVHLVLSASGDQGCWLDGIDVPILSAGCATTASAFVEVVPGSQQVVSGDGDLDGIPDNCETTTVQYQIRNAGSLVSGPVTAVAASPDPGVTFVPEEVCAIPDLGPGASSLCEFTFSLGGEGGEGIPFVLTADSAGNPGPASLAFTLAGEADPHIFATSSFGFEESFEGWTAQNFSLSLARVFSGAQSAHAGSTSIANICAKLTSPAFLLDPGGSPTLSFRLYADIEPLTDVWYDRANVHLVDVETGQHALIVPISGFSYNASGNEESQLCHLNDQAGWGGNLGGFSLVSFNLSPFAGRAVRIEINYNSDEGDDREGIYVDALQLTGAAALAPPADPQGDACSVPEVSAPIAPVPLDVEAVPGDMLRFTWEDAGPPFQYNVYSGAIGAFYDHGASPLICSGLGSGIACDGTNCTYDLSAAGLPADHYFLVTATGFGLEGTSGFPSTGPERDPGQNTCAP